MNRIFNHTSPLNTTREFHLEVDFDNLNNSFALEKCIAEREVLHNINKIELVQCLGLKDKNKTPIYFGDILIDKFGNILTPVIEIANEEHILFFKPLKYLNKKLNIGCKSTYSSTLEVIGNMYQYSELFAGICEKNKFINLVLDKPKNCPVKATLHIEFCCS